MKQLCFHSGDSTEYPNSVFVFRSNLAGRHGAGAALFAAKYHGAKSGVGEGASGNSYAIPTKDAKLHTRSLEEIQKSVQWFIAQAEIFSNLEFFVTAIGTGLRPKNCSASALQWLTHFVKNSGSTRKKRF